MGDVSKNMEKAINNLDDALMKGVEKVCQTIENSAKRKCPKDDGILRASITHWVSELLMAGFVGTNVEYAPYVHEGTGIYANNGNGRKEVPWLYKDEKGKWHSTKGQKPNPFLLDAIKETQGDIIKILGEEARTEWMK